MLPLSCLCSADSKSNSSIRVPLTTATRVSSGWRASISMRMDIENSPGARLELFEAATRHDLGHAGRGGALGGGGIKDKCLCCTGHPASLREKYARRLDLERGLGVLWLHASVNLESRGPSHRPRRKDRQGAGHKAELASGGSARNSATRAI